MKIFACIFGAQKLPVMIFRAKFLILALVLSFFTDFVAWKMSSEVKLKPFLKCFATVVDEFFWNLIWFKWQ